MTSDQSSDSRRRQSRDVTPTSGPETAESWISVVQEKVKTLDYGAVQIVVHAGKVVQVERTERLRFEVRPRE
jgi:hypothetical protein